MADPTGRRLDLGALLDAVEDAPPVAVADVLGRHLAEWLGASDVAFLIADFTGRELVRLAHAGVGGDALAGSQGREIAEPVPLEGTPHGRAFTEQEVVAEPGGQGVRLFAPVTNRGEAIGVLELSLPGMPDEQAMADVALAAHALAYVVIANRRFTDLFDWGRRSVPMSLAAEIQHRLLPDAYTCEGGQFTLAGWLEPAGDIGGDTFDFSMNRDTLHLSLTDAMGHTVDAAILATVVVGALRNARRSGASLEEQANLANAGLGEFARRDAFVTGQLARIDLREQKAIIVNAGHPPPLRLRAGRVEPVQLEADPPFGVMRTGEYRVQPLSLQPGDRFMFITDGMLERNAANVDVQALVLAGAEMHPREAVQHLVQAVLEATAGKLHDDATAMCFDWHGGPPGERTSEAGADA